MYNEEIVESLLKTYGNSNTTQYCKMKSYEYELLIESDYTVRSADEIFDMKYEKDWWNSKYYELLKQKHDKRIIGKIS